MNVKTTQAVFTPINVGLIGRNDPTINLDLDSSMDAEDRDVE